MISQKFAKFLHQNRPPKECFDRAKELILDTIGTALAGCNLNTTTKAVDSYSQICGANNGLNLAKTITNKNANLVKIWGREEYLAYNYAAMANGISAHAQDFDDTHTEAILHASAILAPLCINYGFYLQKSGEEILEAFIKGWEIGARIGAASNGSFHQNGFHTTSVAGVFSAAVAAGVLLELSEDEFVNALGFAASFAGGINEFLSNGSSSKLLHIANAINNGILAANYAKAKLQAPITVFEGRDNIFRAFGKQERSKERLKDGLGTEFEILKVSLKPYPTCHFAHGFIDCALALRDDGMKADDIAIITCFIDQVPASFICDPLEKKQRPNSQYEAKFSLPFLFALAFLDGDITLESLARLERTDVLNLAGKINYEIRPSRSFPKYFPGHIKVLLSSGETVFKDAPINRGNPELALSFDEVVKKFKNNALQVLNETKVEEIIAKIRIFEELSELEI